MNRIQNFDLNIKKSCNILILGSAVCKKKILVRDLFSNMSCDIDGAFLNKNTIDNECTIPKKYIYNCLLQRYFEEILNFSILLKKKYSINHKLLSIADSDFGELEKKTQNTIKYLDRAKYYDITTIVSSSNFSILSSELQLHFDYIFVYPDDSSRIWFQKKFPTKSFNDIFVNKNNKFIVINHNYLDNHHDKILQYTTKTVPIFEFGCKRYLYHHFPYNLLSISTKKIKKTRSSKNKIIEKLMICFVESNDYKSMFKLLNHLRSRKMKLDITKNIITYCIKYDKWKMFEIFLEYSDLFEIN